MKVLLSIKPEYADKIFDGTKAWEYRRKIWSRMEVKTVIVYATAPTSKVVGEFVIGNLIYDKPSAIWSFTKNFAGIDKETFFDYFRDITKGYALGIPATRLYDKPKGLSDFGISRPPQNFMYIGDPQ